MPRRRHPAPPLPRPRLSENLGPAWGLHEKGDVNLALGNLVQAWIEGLQLMRPGDEWILYVPPALGYGDEDKGPIPANSVLIFRIQLLAVNPPSTGPGR